MANILTKMVMNTTCLDPQVKSEEPTPTGIQPINFNSKSKINKTKNKMMHPERWNKYSHRSTYRVIGLLDHVHVPEVD